MKEKSIEQAVSSYAQSKDWLSYKFVSPSQRGVPDRLFLKDDKVIFIEFKAQGKRPTLLQQFSIERIREQGFKVYVVDSIEKGKKIFDKKEC